MTSEASEPLLPRGPDGKYALYLREASRCDLSSRQPVVVLLTNQALVTDSAPEQDPASRRSDLHTECHGFLCQPRVFGFRWPPGQSTALTGSAGALSLQRDWPQRPARPFHGVRTALSLWHVWKRTACYRLVLKGLACRLETGATQVQHVEMLLPGGPQLLYAGQGCCFHMHPRPCSPAGLWGEELQAHGGASAESLADMHAGHGMHASCLVSAGPLSASSRWEFSMQLMYMHQMPVRRHGLCCA